MSVYRNKKAKPNEVMYDAKLDERTHAHFSPGNTELGNGIWNYSTLAGEHPMVLSNDVILTEFLGTCQGCCEHCEPDCYARNYTMRYHNTCIPAYIDNTLLLRHKRDDFFKEMKNLFYYNMVSCFRPHISGEFIDYDHFERIIKFTTTEPDCRFYFYTAKKRFILDYLASGKDFPKNLIPWASCYKPEEGDEAYPFRCYVDDGKNPDPRLKGFFHCPKNSPDGRKTGVTCSTCKVCPLGKVNVVVFWKH